MGAERRIALVTTWPLKAGKGRWLGFGGYPAVVSAVLFLGLTQILKDCDKLLTFPPK